MQIILKGLRGFDIYPENKDYLEQKFLKLEKIVKEPAIVEFTFDHTKREKGSLSKRIHLNFTMPGLKKPLHLEELSEHFPETIDKLYDRFEKFVRRYHEKEVKKNKKGITK